MPTRPEELGGIGAVGATAGLSRYADGRVRNLNVTASGGAFVATFAWDGTAGHRFALYVNGEPVATGAEGDPLETGPMGAGGQEVDVVPFRTTDPAPGLDLSLVGRRPFVRWARSSESDVVAYRVYWDAGTGTLQTASPLATVSRVMADPIVAVAGSTGGRLTLGGNYSGAAINGAFTLSLTSATTWEISAGGRTYSGNVIPGRTANLFGGLTITFLDAADRYDTGDSWTIRIGPRPLYVHPSEVAAGSYKFAVSAVDSSGNESARSATATVVISSEPPPVESVAATWDSANGEIVVTWQDVVGVAEVRVYSNFHRYAESLEQYVMEDGPVATASAPGAETVSIPLGTVRGTVLLYVRAADSDGVEERNATLITVACEDDPPAVLAAPSIVAAAGGPGGAIAATWQVSVETARPAALRFYVSTTIPDWAYAAEDSSVVFPASAQYPVVSGSWVSDGTYSGTVYVAVRAEDDAGNLTPYGDFVTVVTDDSAPAAPTLAPLWP